MATVNKLYLGMDLHKSTSTFCAKDYDGNLIDSSKVVTNPCEIRKYVGKFLDESKELTLAVEPVSQWYYYADLLQNLGVDVHLANPLKVKAIASARVKTDKIDAGVLADLMRGNLLPEAYFSGPETRNWKETVRFRASLINLRTQAKNKIFAVISKNGLVCPYGQLFGKAGRSWLKALNLPEQFKISLTKYFEIVEFLDKLVVEADKKIEETVGENAQAKLLTTIPALSYVSALTIIAEIGEIKRFPSAKQLMGYAGLVPSTYSSGESTRHGKITKQGSRWLRWTMIEAAQRQQLCKKIQGFGWYYNKIKMRKGGKTAAVATARKLLAVIWKMLTENREFESRLPNTFVPSTQKVGKSGMLAK
jgi:transposase